jgi:hypothetical protein
VRRRFISSSLRSANRHGRSTQAREAATLASTQQANQHHVYSPGSAAVQQGLPCACVRCPPPPPAAGRGWVLMLGKSGKPPE